MASVPVELNQPRPVDDTEEIVIIDDLDGLANAAIVMGCGDDNPYR
ncbi:MAG: hypothetical protein ACRDRT_13050 [Pseudonocardiaceae bacterium]